MLRLNTHHSQTLLLPENERVRRLARKRSVQRGKELPGGDSCARSKQNECKAVYVRITTVSRCQVKTMSVEPLLNYEGPGKSSRPWVYGMALRKQFIHI